MKLNLSSIIIFLLFFAFTVSQPVWANSSSHPTTSSDSNLQNTIASFASFVVTLGNITHFDHPKNDFSLSEIPNFTVLVPTTQYANAIETNLLGRKEEIVEARLINEKTKDPIPITIKKIDGGQFRISAIKTNKLTPGNYHLIVTAKETFFYTRDISQDFSWGVLAINTNKSIYALHEKVLLSFGVLSKDGATICTADIHATITDPHGNVSMINTSDASIQKTADCGSDYYTTNPDYMAQYQTNGPGIYQMRVTADNHSGLHSLDDYFQVKDSVPFEVERTAFPTRIYPVVPYPVTITVKANQDYTGPVEDFVPKAFYIENVSGNGTASQQEDISTIKQVTDPNILTEDTIGFAKYHGNISKLVHELISVPTREDTGNVNFVHPERTNIDHTPMAVQWSVDWKKGNTYTLSYTINFPPVPIDLYIVGPLTVGSGTNPVFEEARQWLIASDASKCWGGTGSGSGANWSGTNWVTTGGTTGQSITSSDVAVFDSTSTTCSSNSTNNASTIDTAETVQGVQVLTYTNTITQSAALTMSTSTGYVQSATGSTFTGGSQAITDSGVFTLSHGTFTSTTGTFIAKSDWNPTGGTFNANSGTISFQGGTSALTPSTETYNNVTFDDPCNFATYNLASSTTLTINGTLTLTNESGCNGPIINGAGGISAKGDFSLTSTNGTERGSAVITINGTSTQTMTGVSGGSSGNGAIPSVTINKSSGTLNFRNYITETKDWTYTAGTLDYTGSTIDFNAKQDGTETITPGSTSFNNVTFDGSNTYTMANGTTLTIGGTLTINSGPVINGTGAISAQGDISLPGTSVVKGSVVITVNGTGTQTITGVSSGTVKQGAIPSLTINKSSGTLNIRNNITETKDWTYTAGTVDYTGSTVFFEPSQSGSGTIIPGSTAFNNVSFDDSDCNFSTYTIPSGSTLTVAGTLTLQDTGSGCNGPQINGPGTITAQGDLVTSSPDATSPGGNIKITMSGSANQNLTQNTSKKFPTGNFTINKSGGTVSATTAISLNGTGQTLTISGGTLDMAGFNLTVNSTLGVSSTGTLKLQGGETLSTGSNSFTSAGTITYTGSTTYTNLIAGSTYYNLTFNGSGTWTLNNPLTVNNNLTITSGTLSSGGNNITVTGNWSNSGTYTNGNNTITLNGTGQTISGTTTFYNLTKTVTSSDTLTFAASATQTITHTLILQGAVSNLLSLRSTISGTQFKIDPQGTRTFSYLNPQDSNNINATAIAYDSAFTYGTNLTNWITPSPTPTLTSTPTPTPANSPSSIPPTNPNSIPGWSSTIMMGPHFIGTASVISGGSGTSVAQTLIATNAIHDDVSINITRSEPIDLLTAPNPVPFPWMQGFNTAGSIFNYSVTSAFNGYPIQKFDNPVTIILPYDPTKLTNLDTHNLTIVMYDHLTGKWKKLPNIVIDIQKHTLATTVSKFSYFAVVYSEDAFASGQKFRVLGSRTEAQSSLPELQNEFKKLPMTPLRKEPARSKIQIHKKTCILFFCW